MTTASWSGITSANWCIFSDTPRHVRVYDAPRTPYHRVLDSGVLTDEQGEVLTAVRAELNPAELTRRINHIQNQLIDSAKDKTLARRKAS